MMLLYENGFSDFSSNGICFIFKELFGDVYEWAGQYRIIIIQKRESILAGVSVWYSNSTEIEHDLEKAWRKIKPPSIIPSDAYDGVQMQENISNIQRSKEAVLFNFILSIPFKSYFKFLFVRSKN